MRRFSILCFAVFFAFAPTRLNAQTPLPDSLHLSGTMADTAVAIRLIDEAGGLMPSTADRPLVMAKLSQAEVILKYTFGENSFHFARYLHYAGYAHLGLGDIELTGQFYRQAMLIYQNTVGDHDRAANLLHQMGVYLYYVMNDPDAAIPYFLKSTEMADRLNIPSQSWQGLAGAYQEKGDDFSALRFVEEQLKRAMKFFDSTDIKLSNAYEQAAFGCSNCGDFDRAIEYLKIALHIGQKSLADTDPYILSLLKHIGYCYNETGDYDRSLACYQEALASEQVIADTAGITISLSEMGRAYTGKGDYARAMSVLTQAQKLVDKYPVELGRAGVYLYMGHALHAQGKMQEALEQYHKDFDIRVKLEGLPTFDLLAPLLSIAGIHTLAGEYQTALPFYHRIMGILESLPKADHPYMAIVFNNYADLFQRQGQFEQADSLYQLAWRYFRYVGTDSLAQVHGLNHLLPCIYARGNFYRNWFQHTGRAELLERSLQTFKAFDKGVQFHRLRLSEGSKAALSQAILPGYEGAIAANLLSWKTSGDERSLDQAFRFSEKARSLQLFEALRESEARRFSGIPDALLEQEHALRIDLTFAEKRYNDLLFEQNKHETDTVVLALSNHITALRSQYTTLQHHFEQEYPDYFNLKYALSRVTAAYVQDTLLETGQILLEYFVGDSNIYLFALSPDTFSAIDIKRNFPLDSLVAQMREALLGGRYENADPRYLPAVKQYTAVAQELYRRLLAPIAELIDSPGNEGGLVIVPDGSLATLPFEALLTGPPPDQASRFKDYPYFLQSHPIRYCYSATLLREMQGNTRNKPNTPHSVMLAMAPFSQSGYHALQNETRQIVDPNSLRPLPATREEVLEIQRIWSGKGKVLLGTDATKDAFIASSNSYSIIQLATHGKADYRSGDYSYLAFASRKDTLALLHVRDIYNLSIRADLVVLSACETGVGRYRRGEGVLSLARAFSYAGAKSIVTTLWSTDDNCSKELMVEFHRQLRNGQRKDVALRNAQSFVLKDPFYAHPYYWAGFIAIGDNVKIRF